METANLSNWKTRPHNQWAFRNVEKLIPTKPIGRSSNPSTFEPVKSFASTIFMPVLNAANINSTLKDTDTDGYILLHRGKLVREYYNHENNADTKHIFMSITKGMTGLIAGKIISKGLFKVEDKVISHLPELKGTAFEASTIRDLLDMRSGVQQSDQAPDYEAAWYWRALQDGQKQLSFSEVLQSTRSDTNKAAGHDFDYVSINTDVIGMLLERKTGKKLPELIHEHLWQPSGAAHDAMITTDNQGFARASGGLVASVEDLARIGQALLDGKLVDRAWIDDMLSNGDQAAFARSPWGGFTRYASDFAYRSFWCGSKDLGTLMLTGIHGQLLMVDFKKEIVMAKTSSQGEFFDVKKAGKVLIMFRVLQLGLKFT